MLYTTKIKLLEFMVDIMLVLERQIIVNKFKAYFAFIATKLNDDEKPETEITLLETFNQFVPPSN